MEWSNRSRAVARRRPKPGRSRAIAAPSWARGTDCQCARVVGHAVDEERRRSVARAAPVGDPRPLDQDVLDERRYPSSAGPYSAPVILCLGEAIVDLVCERELDSPADADEFRPCFGGALANVAVSIARSGGESGLAGGVRRRPLGHWLAQRLEAEGVATDRLSFVAGVPTPIAIVTFDREREADFHVYGEGIEATVCSVEDEIEPAVGAAEALAFGSNTLVGERERALTMRARALAPRPRPCRCSSTRTSARTGGTSSRSPASAAWSAAQGRRLPADERGRGGVARAGHRRCRGGRRGAGGVVLGDRGRRHPRARRCRGPRGRRRRRPRRRGRGGLPAGRRRRLHGHARCGVRQAWLGAHGGRRGPAGGERRGRARLRRVAGRSRRPAYRPSRGIARAVAAARIRVDPPARVALTPAARAAGWVRPRRARVRAIRDRLRELYGWPRNEPHEDPVARTRPDDPLPEHERPQPRRRLRAAARRASTTGRIRDSPTPGWSRRSGPAGSPTRRPRGSRRCCASSASRDRPRLAAEARRASEAIDYLVALPGVGRKTAACVMIFAFDRPEIPVDTHVIGSAAASGCSAAAPVREAHEEMLRDHRPRRRVRVPHQPDHPRAPGLPAAAPVRRVRARADVPGLPRRARDARAEPLTQAIPLFIAVRGVKYATRGSQGPGTIESSRRTFT